MADGRLRDADSERGVSRDQQAGSLEHTSLVFIGIPALIAVTIVLMPRSTSVTGVILKAIPLALALSGILLGEGFVCILFAAPLFYLVGLGIGLAADWQRSAERENRINGTVIVVLLILGPSSLEGVIPGFEFGRDATVTRTRVVAGSASDVEAALGRVPRFERELPAFFKLGFPTPGVTGGEGLTIGAERRIEFVHGAHHPGSLVLRVASRTPRSVTFRPAHDDSYITHWLSWRDIDVEWRELAPGRTEVSWTLRYRRRLDPAWYFAPLERYATGLAAGYLIDTLATRCGCEAMSRELAIRAFGLYGPIALAAAAWVMRARPRHQARKDAIAATMATIWALIALPVVHVIAIRAGWWTYAISGGALLGMPVDLYLGWAFMWGALPMLAWPRAPLAVVVALFALMDIAVMPFCARSSGSAIDG